MAEVVVYCFGVKWHLVKREDGDDLWDGETVCHNFELHQSFAKVEQHLKLVLGIDYFSDEVLGLESNHPRWWVTFEVFMRIAFKSFYKQKKHDEKQKKVVKNLFKRIQKDMMEGPITFISHQRSRVGRAKKKPRRQYPPFPIVQLVPYSLPFFMYTYRAASFVHFAF